MRLSDEAAHLSAVVQYLPLNSPGGEYSIASIKLPLPGDDIVHSSACKCAFKSTAASVHIHGTKHNSSARSVRCKVWFGGNEIRSKVVQGLRIEFVMSEE